MNKNFENMPMYNMPFSPMENLSLARVYVVSQPYVGMVPLSEGLKRGSIFPNLYQPYITK